MEPTQPPIPIDPKEHVSNALPVMQPGEKVIADIKRSPVGILYIYILSALLLAIVSILILGILPHMTANGAVNTLAKVILILLLTISVTSTFIFTIIYWENAWVVTSDSITAMTQRTLFDRSSSQLSLNNIEDVTAEQRGILQRIFNYGQLRLETAGKSENYTLNYVPNPNFYASEILDAREVFIEKPLPDENTAYLKNYVAPVGE